MRVLVVDGLEQCKAVIVVHEALGCIFLQWATEDEEKMTSDIGESLTKSESQTEEWFWLVPFSSIVSMVQGSVVGYQDSPVFGRVAVPTTLVLQQSVLLLSE